MQEDILQKIIVDAKVIADANPQYPISVHVYLSMNKAIELGGDDPQLLIRRAYVFKLMARGDRAMSDLDTALASDPKNHQALLLRGSPHRRW